MTAWNRRSVLAAGAAFTMSGIASTVTGSEGVDAAELPDPGIDPNPGMDEDWASFAGDAGHARYIADGHEFDGKALEAAWSVDHDGAVAVADDVVYTTTADGVVALDAADGSVIWENIDVDADAPAVAGETVYLDGGEIVALNRENGSVRWKSELGPEEWTGSHTVAYDGVFVVVDSTLYALEADDGSVRWRKESAVVESSDGDKHESGFITGAAAANGVVYAGTETGTFAFDPATGEAVWRDKTWSTSITGQSIYATETAVLLERSGPELALYDAQTGERVGLPPVRSGPTLSNESVIGGDDTGYGSHSIHGDEYDWTIDVTYTYGQAVISGETVYVYFRVDGHNYGDRDYDQKLVALDKRDGSEKWTLSKDDAPVGRIRAISGETIYVDHDGELVVLREQTDEEEGDGADDDAGDNTGEGDNEQGGSEDEDQQQDGEDDSDTGKDNSDDGGSSGDDGESVDTDDGDVGNGNAGNEDARNETDTENNSDADIVPGFTAGGGLLGGALGLEWLRRKAGVDESTSVNESSE
ncbi:PQQ-binding-like beta-propeller repeat protein [Natrinema soli]|uniref:PQQ-binding-like beta-propeller repeat protein n=1 Tax=Natrinema soli TaxID=1930624 RepID=A0ABD5SHX0_9EURY|nr:PQQ-binding-like beta-propeller repeat protein [Natrinema soli]